MKKIVTIALLALTGLDAAAYSVKGVVADARDTEPLPGALCRICQASDTTQTLLRLLTDSDGAFAGELPAPGEYLMKTEYMGYNPAVTTFVAGKDNPDVNLGMIYLAQDTQTLDGVTVTARRPVIQTSGDKVTYNMEEDPESQTTTVIDMLRKVPMVTVDAQDNIQVNGQSSFKILINGKENPMLNAYAKDILKAMPASAVKKIEVITEPGAKYDAEGVGGILNIITEGETAVTDGYSMTVRGELDNTDAGAGVNALWQMGKVTASANYSYNRTYSDRSQDVTIERDILGDNPMSIIMEGQQYNRHTMHRGALDLSWEPDDKNLFNVSANLFLGMGNTPVDLLQTTRDASGREISSFRQRQTSEWDWGSWSIMGSYQHSFGKPDHNIVLSYLFNKGVNKTSSLISYSEAHNTTLPDMQHNITRNPTNEHTLQLDYTNPLDEHNKIETGAKAIFRRNSSDGSTIADISSSIPTPADQDVRLKQHQDVAAAYASFSSTYGSWNAKAGLRYEYTRMGVDFISGAGENFRTDLNDLVPNAAVSYNISPMSNLRLAYQMRISRPTVSQLNPYRDDSSPLSVEYGNPDLTSERSNNITLTYSNFGQKFGLNLSASYFITNNSIGQYSYTQGGKIYTTYANTGRNQTSTVNAYLMYSPISKLQITLNGSVSYNDMRFDKMDIANHGWGTSAFLNANYTLPASVRLTAYGGMMHQGVGLQSDGMGTITFYALSAAKSFLDDRLTLTASASNFFAPLKIKMNSWTADSHTGISVRVPISSFGVSLSYRFGGNSRDVKKVSSQIDNDDLQKSTGGTTISGK